MNCNNNRHSDVSYLIQVFDIAFRFEDLISYMCSFCSVLGSILVVLGLYLVTWGQAEDRHLASRSINFQPVPDGQVVIKPLTSFKEPLLG